VTPRRVGVNLLWLVPGVVGGSEDYSVRLLDAFARHGRDHPDLEVTLFVNRRFPDAHPGLVAALPTVVAPLDGGHKGRRVVAEWTWLPRAFRRRGIELAHHLGGTMPLTAGCPGIVTIHDLQPLTVGERFSWVKRTYLRLTVGPSVRRARWVTTLSRWVADDVVARCGVPAERMVRIPAGAEPPAAVSPARAAEVRARYGLGERPYVLYPAITYPHKNHVTLVRALALVRARGVELGAVLTGGAGSAEVEVRAEIDRLGLGDLVHRPGRVPAEDLAALYAGALAVTLPSHYEGFNLPVLEAMGAGCPVLASRAGALPEVVDDAGVLLDPDDPDAWAEAMVTMTLPGEREAWVARARARAARFSWDAAAEALAELYRRPLGGPGR
jgi:alpha-1,3-rhamnosyl/mannosyltransferase